MTSLIKVTSIAAVSAMVLFVGGCDRKDTNTTSGERSDNVSAEVKQESREVGNTVEETTDKVAQSVDDAAITTTIKAKLIADDELKAMDINVDTNGGVVTLTGAAPSLTAVERATTIAKAVDGVSNVKNQLTTN